MTDVREDRGRCCRLAGCIALSVVFAGLIIATSGYPVFAQLTSKPVEFDVASIRPDLTESNSSSINRSGGRITLENVSLRDCIASAYDIPTGRDYELSGPGWLDVEKFDIAATFPPETSRDRVREMLQSMLAERFALRTHTENKKIESYALVIGRKVPKLPDLSASTEGAFIWGENQLTARAISMAGLADRLSGTHFKLGRPVVDMTGIKGAYDFILKWAPDDAPADASVNASIFTALREQLGLKLEPRKIAFRILVIDHVERVPSEN
jgi:uncharacterized protein (TIGR03435 family)